MPITKDQLAAAKNRPITLVAIDSDGFMGNARVTEGWMVECGRRKYAQYDNAPFVIFVPKGKRKPVQWLGTYKPFGVVFEGHGLDFQVPGFFGEPEDHGAVVVTRGRHSGCSPAWREEAEAAVAARPDLKIVFDGRGSAA